MYEGKSPFKGDVLFSNSISLFGSLIFLTLFQQKVMKINANSQEEYISKIPEDRIPHFKELRRTILDNIPNGFQEVMSYGMIGYVVPKSIYPAGYHCTPELPLLFANIASQNNEYMPIAERLLC